MTDTRILTEEEPEPEAKAINREPSPGTDVDPVEVRAIEEAAIALRLADGDGMSGDYAYELAEATVAAYLAALSDGRGVPEREGGNGAA